MYLESPTDVSCDGRSQVSTFNKWLYGNQYLRERWTELTTQITFTAPFFDTIALIVPGVDCSFGSIRDADATVARIFYLVRRQNRCGRCVRGDTHYRSLLKPTG